MDPFTEPGTLDLTQRLPTNPRLVDEYHGELPLPRVIHRRGASVTDPAWTYG
jgi:hypothetical protein